MSLKIKYVCNFIFCMLLFTYVSNSQDYINKNTYKSQKYIFTQSDSLTLLNGNTLKFDTLYIRNLNDNKKEDHELETWLPVLTAFLGGALAIFGQYFIKRIENKGQRKTLINSKGLEHLENIATKINSLSLLDPQNSQSILNGIDELRLYCFQNNLYVDKQYENIINQIGDYYSGVARNPASKDIQQEDVLWIQFKKIFNK